MITTRILIGLVVLPALLVGDITESARLVAITNHMDGVLKEKLLVICDLDNTLMQSAQQLGSVGWGEYVVDTLVGKGLSRQQAHEVEHILWETIQPRIQVRVVDSETAQILRDIQDKGVFLIGLTSRFPCESEYTFLQLHSLDINFRQPERQVISTQPEALFAHGILFSTTLNRKSDVLFAFLEKNRLQPGLIIFIDDKSSNVEDIHQACVDRGIACIGIRFSGADESVRQFNPLIAEAQWEAFPVVLTDEEASVKIANKKLPL